jgi:hypothetical protein
LPEGRREEKKNPVAKIDKTIFRGGAVRKRATVLVEGYHAVGRLAVGRGWLAASFFC